jgi:hypothetical protein
MEMAQDGEPSLQPVRKSNKALVDSLFKPDVNGVSDWVEVVDLDANGLRWSSNGNARYGVFFSVDEYNWETRRKNDSARGAVTALRTTGFRVDASIPSTVEPRIKEHFAGVTHCNLSLMPLDGISRNVDHRYGYKDHPTYIALLQPEAQKPEHFQLLHQNLNLIKRQMCIECVSTRIRPAHPELGYVEGGPALTGENPCGGCYLAEPERYRSAPAVPPSDINTP